MVYKIYFQGDTVKHFKGIYVPKKIVLPEGLFLIKDIKNLMDDLLIQYTNYTFLKLNLFQIIIYCIHYKVCYNPR